MCQFFLTALFFFDILEVELNFIRNVCPGLFDIHINVFYNHILTNCEAMLTKTLFSLLWAVNCCFIPVSHKKICGTNACEKAHTSNHIQIWKHKVTGIWTSLLNRLHNEFRRYVLLNIKWKLKCESKKIIKSPKTKVWLS